MLPESDRRLLTEFLGECWHDDPIFREYIPGVEHIQFVELECSKSNTLFPIVGTKFAAKMKFTR